MPGSTRVSGRSAPRASRPQEKVMNIAQYFKDARAELGKVSWPSRQQVLEGTQAVLIFVVALTVIVWVMDLLFTNGINAALGLR